jgi:hypothetical protein
MAGNMVGPGVARLGSAGHGMEQGTAGQGMAWQGEDFSKDITKLNL